MLTAIEWQRHQDSWLVERGRFIPRPAKWIEDRRWTDEPNTTPHLSKREIALGRTMQEFLK